jgi:hypothetical protein
MLLAGTAVTALGTFLPFARSGERMRSSYELIAVARRLDVVPEGWPEVVTRLWFLVPLLLAVCWVLVIVGLDRPAAWCALGVVVAALVAVAVVWRSPLDLAAGCAVTVAGAAVLASGAGLILTRQGGR